MFCAPHRSHRRAPRRSLARSAAAGALTALLTLSGAGAAVAGEPSLAGEIALAGPASTEDAVPLDDSTHTPDEETETETATGTLTVAPVDPILLDEANEYRFSVVIDNSSEEALPAGQLRLMLHPQRLENVAQLDAIEADPTASSDQPAALLAQISVAETPPNGVQELTISVNRAAFPLSLVNEEGVYAVNAELRLPATEPLEATAVIEPLLTSASTPFVWQGTGGVDRVPVTLIVPLVLPENVRTMPSITQLSEIAPRLTELLASAESHQATLAVDPRIVAGIRAFGSEAPASAQEFLERLTRTEQPTFMLQFADADPAVQSALGFTELLQPSGLSYLTRLGTFDAEPAPGDADPEAPGDTAATDAAGTADELDSGDAPDTDADTDTDTAGVPDLAELTAMPQATAGAWPATGQVDTATLGLLSSAGVTSLVLDSGSVPDASGTRVNLNGFDTLVADAGLSAASRAALSGENQTDRAAGLAELTTRLALAAQQGSTGVVLALDRSAVADAAEPAQLIDIVADLDWVEPVAESFQPEGTGTLRAGEPLEQRRELLRATVARSAEIDELAPLLEQPEYLTEYQRVRLLESLSTRYGEAEVDFGQVDERTRARDEELLTGVRVISTASTQLVGTSSRVPVTLHNALPFTASVTLRITPTSAGISLPERTFVAQQVPADGNQVVLVTVKSRVSSGESGLRVEMSDAADQRVFVEHVLQIAIRSSYETIMLIALGVLAALLLGLGTWRSIRHRDAPPSLAVQGGSARTPHEQHEHHESQEPQDARNTPDSQEHQDPRTPGNS